METTEVYWGPTEKSMETTIKYWGNIGIMEKKMETTIEYWSNIGITDVLLCAPLTASKAFPREQLKRLSSPHVFKQ